MLIENIKNVSVLCYLNNGLRLGRVSTDDFVSRSEVVLVTLVSLLGMNKRVG